MYITIYNKNKIHSKLPSPFPYSPSPLSPTSPPAVQEHQSFFDRVRVLRGQPRSLQHLCRGVVRRYLGSACHSAIGGLPVPGTVKDYLLLCNDGTLR